MSMPCSRAKAPGIRGESTYHLALTKGSFDELSPRLDTCHFWLLSSSRAWLKVSPQANQESTCINLQTAPCLAPATRHSSRKSSVFEPAVAWPSRAFISVVSSAPHAPRWPTHGFAPCAQRRSLLQCWLHSGHHQLGRVHLAYGSQIGVHMCGERPAAVIPTHAAGNNFCALRSLSSSSNVINWPGS